MLSNAGLLAKFRFDTAENEPAKNLQNFAHFANRDLLQGLSAAEHGCQHRRVTISVKGFPVPTAASGSACAEAVAPSGGNIIGRLEAN